MAEFEVKRILYLEDGSMVEDAVKVEAADYELAEYEARKDNDHLFPPIAKTTRQKIAGIAYGEIAPTSS